MITRKETMQTCLQIKGALDTGNGDVSYLRFLLNKACYELSQGLMVGDFEADPLTRGWTSDANILIQELHKKATMGVKNAKQSRN
jgi:hypothetical protein